MPQVGDKVQVITKKSTEEGILMPSSNENVTIIKLDTGYNVGFKKEDIKEVKLIKEKTKEQSKPKKEIPKKENLKTISILHCGGTIASKVDYETGAVKAKFSPEELLEMFPELGNLVNLRSKLVANMLSENMRFVHYNIIAKEIEKEIKAGSEGIIITHGTDMLHYTSAALAFVLENLNIPVLLVGAQRSSDRGSSDAFLNLKCAANFIANTDFAEVALCMHNSANDDVCSIIPGVKARKMHSSRRDAFKSINAEPFALIDNDGKIDWLRNDYVKRDGSKKLTLKLFKENLKIGIIKAHPQMFAEEIKAYEKFDGLILEGTGLGHFPVEKYDDHTKENELIFKEIETLAKKIPVVMTTQTIFGGINMNVYSPGRKLQEAGVLGNLLDMTAETALIKLAWLLSNYPKEKIKKLFSQNFRGEISSQRNYQEEFC
ncbi:MAG: Glu-tRNA(Gln) amidotransferase subunit GatD [Nanoarchaeota archaeon]|nr:Glu-tRNA(Gln) amidotransferase subunit GatD [Nanoarchaeota archaeon]MBU1631770.1 Glu-tRNA(Gln) amidotransferase subunit GatD [Nanoarchaeota archaeon]MBU1876170.1 Glu-tRNA(Gln) amidotransferase subunit GatD [Nanoarchaeota archaeon]